jgi:hypothetical protein
VSGESAGADPLASSLREHRDAARDLLRELLAEALANGNGPQATVPPAPVAAVHRPSTWSQPAAPGELIGDRTAPSSARTEVVRLDSDADLAAFVRAVLERADDVRAGRLQFTLGGSSPAGATHVRHGAVTERTIKKAAEAGSRLVLGPGAVVTPLAREKARALGVDIERER